MSVIAIGVFVVTYALIASDRVSKTRAALVGAAIMLAVGIVDSHDVFYSHDTGIDWDVIFLLLGMMIIVSVLRQTGVFEYIAIWAVKRANGSPTRIMILLVLVMAFGSALLDNVTTVLLIAPVTLLVCDRLAINPSPFLMAEVFAANIGGAATLVGDPPNIIIASRAGLSFNDFLLNMAPVVLIVLVIFVALLPRLFGSVTVEPERVSDVMSLNEREAISDRKLLIKCGVVLLAVFATFIAHPVLHIQPSVVALLGAGVLIIISGLGGRDYLASVEWETLLFFAGLFIMVGALVKTGVVDKLARASIELTGGNELFTVLLIIGVSAPVSGIIDNIPYVATMTPIVTELVAVMPGQVNPDALWWALALGADFGGNLTAVGASANVVMLGIARRAGTPISFWEFTRKGIVVTTISLLVAAAYLWLRYFVWS
ncbi:MULTISPECIES: ArsB/NhaD family transporter [Mycobacterium]|uniref:Arsenic-transport integral membrane protein ArsB1 n=3 Tax=Mycobacterium ulcerans group TaxID=2993898 RepID=B2HM15_MYCMM|nr:MULTISPECIES: ArsB/NhaD family transporter [Mycobacterium]ACC40479.1 arsenic-transport integral membrane protein ArsB1 [Mycobacterium marinum M]AGC62081.1 arsenic-transport integral membrane protein ArsB1 [Mycobacterium liflandii 128FXT]EPQ48389.1 Na+/H+ antiporter NhaD type [Mycobacterium sp. 012931]MBC9861849.1 putative anion permease [Mycobacterium pseudoshottsii]MDC9003736.1 ArsB/NhaD family transporter [Mycobacterium marinum]